MKSLALVMALVQAAVDADKSTSKLGAGTDDSKLIHWVSPFYLGALTMWFFIFFMIWWSVSLLISIETPAY